MGHKRELSEADRLIQDLVDSHLPDPSIDDTEDFQTDNIDVVTQSSASLIDDIVEDSATPSVDDLVNQAIAGVPFPDELPPLPRGDDHALADAGELSPNTGSHAEALVEDVVSNITNDVHSISGTTENPGDSSVLGDGTLGVRAQTLLEQVVNASVHDLENYDS